MSQFILIFCTVCFSILLGTGNTSLAQNPELPQKIKELELQVLEGEVPTYYSREYQARATYLQELVTEAHEYFQDTEVLGVQVDLHLILLGPEDWSKYSQLPYGIAHVLPDPPSAILAASEDSEIVNNILSKKDHASGVTLKQLGELDVSYREAATTLVDLIGFHEMGHIYAHHFGCDTWPEQKWLCEFVATYIAYAYMKEKQSKMASLWKIMNDQNANNSVTKHTSLSDFESLYIKVGTDNYGWYQAKFFQKVEEIYEESGIDFLYNLQKSLSKNPVASENDPYRIKELDAVYPGFITWEEELEEYPE